jgi:putative membrane protein
VEEIQPKQKAASPARWLLRVLQGALIGMCAILPGISGGVLCVVFGIYQPMMALLAHPFRTFKTHAVMLFPVLIGWVLGFVGLAWLVEWLFTASATLTVWLFIGLIAGMLPSLFKEAGRDGHPRSAQAALFISMVAILAILVWVQYGTAIAVQPNIWWFFVCGLLWGLSLVVPGLNSSSLLIYLGLYQPMVTGIAAFSLEVIVPMFAGVFLLVLLSARGINYLFNKHYTLVFHIILGFVIASTLAVVPLRYPGGIGELLLCLLCGAAGFIVALYMDKAGRKFQNGVK